MSKFPVLPPPWILPHYMHEEVTKLIIVKENAAKLTQISVTPWKFPMFTFPNPMNSVLNINTLVQGINVMSRRKTEANNEEMKNNM